MKIKYTPWFFLLAIIISSCSRPSSPIIATATNLSSTSSSNDLATQVSLLLTKMPGETSLPTTIPLIATATPSNGQAAGSTDTVEPPPTQAPTNTLAATSTLTASSTPTIILTPSNTPLPTATFPPSDPRNSLGSPTWEDNFQDASNWPTGDDKYTKIEFTQNNLVLTALTNFDGWRLTFPQIQKVYLEMTAKMPNCSGIDHYGLLFRVPSLQKPDQGYLFGITCDGQYSLRKWNNPTMTSLIYWKKNTNILTGANQVNRIGVKTSGNTISLYINGVSLGDIADASYPSAGNFGIFVGSNKTTNLAVWISHIAYWNLP